jgi:hypothetical protein
VSKFVSQLLDTRARCTYYIPPSNTRGATDEGNRTGLGAVAAAIERSAATRGIQLEGGAQNSFPSPG